MPRRLLLLFALAALVAGHGAGAAAAGGGGGGIGVRLLDELGVATASPLARSYIVNRLMPGESVTRRIEISNTTRRPAAVGVYPAAATLDRGTFVFAPGKTGNELTSWTSVSGKKLVMAAGSTAVETVTVHVPAGAAPGERYGVIWATVSAPGGTSVPVMLVNRVGIRVYLTVGPGGAARADFAITGLAAQRSTSGEPTVVATIANTGGRTLAVAGTLMLTNGPAGQRAGPFPTRLAAPLSPGEEGALTIRLDPRLPRGPWTARIALGGGGVHRTATETIVFPLPLATTAPETSADSALAGHRYTMVMSMLLALAVLGLLVTRRRLLT